LQEASASWKTGPVFLARASAEIHGTEFPMHFKQTRQVAKAMVWGANRRLIGAALGITLGALGGVICGMLWGGLDGALHAELGRILACGLNFAAAGAVAGGLTGILFGIMIREPGGDQAQPPADAGEPGRNPADRDYPALLPEPPRENRLVKEGLFRRSQPSPN
jgi:hypothetical protein